MTDDAALREAAARACTWLSRLSGTGASMPEDNARDLYETIAALQTALAARGDARDDPEADGTDAAHPAWWRGHDHTTAVFCSLVHQVLDGEDNGKGVAREPWESLRRRLLQIARGDARMAERERELRRRFEESIEGARRSDWDDEPKRASIVALQLTYCSLFGELPPKTTATAIRSGEEP